MLFKLRGENSSGNLPAFKKIHLNGHITPEIRLNQKSYGSTIRHRRARAPGDSFSALRYYSVCAGMTTFLPVVLGPALGYGRAGPRGATMVEFVGERAGFGGGNMRSRACGATQPFGSATSAATSPLCLFTSYPLCFFASLPLLPLTLFASSSSEYPFDRIFLTF